MAKQLIARGQVSINKQDDLYQITQTVSEYIFSAENNGTILKAVSFTSTIKIMQGDTPISNFAIGSITKPAGFSAITVNQTSKTVTYSVVANTTSLADTGIISIPVTVNNETYHLSFVWSKIKNGNPGSNGEDAYTVRLSKTNCVIATDKDGKIHADVPVTTTVSALKGTAAIPPVIGTLPSVSGCTLSKSGTNITLVFKAGTALAENGIIEIPVIVDTKNFTLSFAYAKARAGNTGPAGVDSNLLDWVNDWNNNKTVIDSYSVITPKIFAGVKNSNGTISGIAIGKFSLSTINAAGGISTEAVNGIYGFRDGHKTFFIDQAGNVQLGNNHQSIKYNSSTGKIEFGTEVSLNWTGAANEALALAQSYADTKKTEAVNAAASDTTEKLHALQIGGINLACKSAKNIWGGIVFTDSGFTAVNTASSGIRFANTIFSPLTDYYLSFKIQRTSGSLKTIGGHLGSFTGKAVYIDKEKYSYLWSSPAVVPVIDDGEWHLVELFFSSKESLTDYLYIQPGRSAASVCSYEVKEINIRQGHTRVDWAPSLLDVTEDITEAKKTSSDAQAVADAITKTAGDEKWSSKLTYIDANGIFTGTLSANTVNAVKLNASQISAGVIDTARLNVSALKSELITAANIDALTLNVVRGKIGGWTIDGDSVFRGTKNNAASAFTTATASITIGSNGIRGFKWYLDATGAGALAGGNIAWDASGNVTFSPAVSLNWTNSLSKIETALGGNAYPKLTQIDANGIYTGTLNAGQINVIGLDASKITVGALSAERIASGSITAAKLDAASIQSEIINAGYINALSCSFVKGTIGGISISSESIYHSLNGRHFILKSTDGDSPLGSNRGHRGFTLFSDDSYVGVGRVKIIQIGALADMNTAQSYSSETNYGFRIALRGGKDIFRADQDGSIIAGWNIDTDSLFLGTKRNTAAGFTTADGSITLGSNGIRGYKWRLDASGAGAVAGGNISWDADGNVTFASSVSLNWTASLSKIETALGGSSYPKLTQINSLGIYTGILTANQINVTGINASMITTGTLSADRIAAGSIMANKLNVSNVQASIVTATVVNGLTCAFTKGTLGGWTIDTGSIYSANLVISHSPRRIAVFGTDSSISAGSRTMLYWNSNSDWGFWASNSVGTAMVRLGSVNHIAGWNIDTDSISRGTKNNTSSAYTSASGAITIGSNGIRGYKWRLDSTGAGAIAGGNISWDTSGNVSFASSVSLKWTQYTDSAMNELVVGGKNYALETSNTWSAAVTLTNTFNQCLFPYKVMADGWAVGDKIQVSFDYKYENMVRGTGGTNLLSMQGSGNTTAWGAGGFNGKHFLDQIDFVKKSGMLPITYSFTLTADHIKNAYFDICIRHDYLTGKAYIRNLKVEKGSKPTDWTPAPEDAACRLTQITSDGIYTGTITASQIHIDSALVVGGSTYNGSISVRDASNAVKVTLNRSGITAVGGTIGGWTIASTQISKNGIILGADGSITNGGKWKLNYDGSGQFAGGNISWTNTGSVTMTGTINASAGKIGGFTISSGNIGYTATAAGGGGGLAIYNEFFRVGSASSYAMLGDDCFPAIAGGSFKTTARITNTRADSIFTNIGIYIDVKNARSNYGIHSNAAIMGPAMISNKLKIVPCGSGSYSVDFSQCNIFYVYATANCALNLPPESQVAEMFRLSSLPNDFACMVTFVYNYNYDYTITFNSIRDHGGSQVNYKLSKGDSITLLCAKFPSFHYQILNHHY